MYNEENIKFVVKELEGELEGDGIGRYALNTLSSFMFKPKGWTKPDVSTPYPYGIPPKSLLIKMADASYDINPAKIIDGWTLIKETKTLKFYKKGNVIIVAIRGTADGRDVYADMKIARGNLEKSTRFIEDLKVMNEVLKENPKDKYYGVGHSLGGAILDLFIEKGYLKSGVSYNPAVEKRAFNSKRNYRIYMENDPLFNLIGKYSKIGEVRKQKGLSKLDAVASVQSVKAHTLNNFEGGGIISSIKHIFSPATKYNNKSTETINQYGDCNIESLKIMRTPLKRNIDVMLKIISFGKWNPKKHGGYDTLFHTALIADVKCDDNSTHSVVIEKNEVLNITTSFKINDKSEMMVINLPSGFNKTLIEFLKTAENSVSKKQYFQYDAFKNNCQDFMKIVLSANNLYNSKYDKFIHQDIAKLLQKNKLIKTISKPVTDLAGIISRLRGKGYEEEISEEEGEEEL